MAETSTTKHEVAPDRARWLERVARLPVARRYTSEELVVMRSGLAARTGDDVPFTFAASASPSHSGTAGVDPADAHKTQAEPEG